ncbi:MAG: hypothetical protein RR874_08360 [Aeromonas sp.]|uniref:hypothetical protein n=1 Tax=Aeromonas sp. TaxID=647 RepID=UPI002FC99F2A
MPNAPSPKGRITSDIDRALRMLIKTAFESGYHELDYERIKGCKSSFSINTLLGISKEDASAIMWDELTQIAMKIQREHELRETQIAKF